MKFIQKNTLATVILSLTAAAALLACGGGGGAPAAVTTDPVTAASTATATNIGATLIAGATGDEEVYNIAADIGDTWQLVLNNRSNTYVMRVLSTQYGLTSTAAASFTKTSAGFIINISDSTASALSVQIDSRTKTLAGRATVGGKKATLAGSGYTVPNTTLLVGNYIFAGTTRNVLDGLFLDNPVGSFIVAANGVDITVCDRGIVVNNACAPVPNSGTMVVTSKALKVVRDSATGLLMLKDGTRDFGVLHVSAGDRGPVLILDRFGLNDENVLRAGIIFAGKAVKLAGTELNGTFNCSINGVDTGNVVVTGNTYTVRDLQRNTNTTGTFQYNKLASGNGLVAIDADGLVIVQNADETLAQASFALPLSSSLAVVSNREGTLDICRRTS